MSDQPRSEVARPEPHQGVGPDGAPIDIPDEQVDSGAYRRLLRNRGFRRLWWSQFISGVGDWLVIGFLMPLVKTLSGGSSFAVAGILIAKILPALLLSSFTGALVDRFDRRKVMIAADLTRAVLCLLLFTTNSLAVIYLTVFLIETASLFFVPAKNALIPRLTEERDLAAANGLSYTTQQASMLVGLTASGAILAILERVVRLVVAAKLPIVSSAVGLFELALIGPRAGVILDSLTFLLSAWAIVGIKVDARPEHHGAFDLSLIGKDVIESFQFLGQHKELRGLLVTIGLAILGGGAIVPVGLVYIDENLVPGRLLDVTPQLQRLADLPQFRQLAAAPSTFMLVFLALGMVVGALFVPRIERRFRVQVLFLGSVTLFGAAMFGFASVRTYWAASLFAIVAGAGIATVTVAGNTYVVRTTSDELRGRVFSALEAVVRVSLLLSMIVVAPLADLAAKFLTGAEHALRLPASYLTPTRVTLQLASLVVLAAAAYGSRTLQWRACEEGAETTGEPACD